MARLENLVGELGATPAQLAIAWLLHQGTDVVPIPGTKRVATLEENAGAVALALSDDQVLELSGLFPQGLRPGTATPIVPTGTGRAPGRPDTRAQLERRRDAGDRSDTRVCPLRPRVRSSSARRHRRTCRTPSSPPTASPYT